MKKKVYSSSRISMSTSDGPVGGMLSDQVDGKKKWEGEGMDQACRFLL
jgi:hypothetical protein